MLRSLFPLAHERYSSLPILGGVLEKLCGWLHSRGYPPDAIRRRVASLSLPTYSWSSLTGAVTPSSTSSLIAHLHGVGAEVVLAANEEVDSPTCLHPGSVFAEVS